VPYIITLDQSTSATKALIFDATGRLVDKASVEHKQYYPRPGWVEHDADEIYENTLSVLNAVIKRNRSISSDLLCLSITNQRETIVVFDRQSGKPLYRAVVWLCRRGAPVCEELVRANYNERVQKITGLKLDTYFPAPKLRWLFENHSEITRQVCAREALIGTIDSYLIYRLTRGRVHATDNTNASRTLLYDIGRLRWDEELCRVFKVPIHALAVVKESSSTFGETNLGGVLTRSIPICGVMGDSQAALFAERCFRPGTAKVTMGSGCSVLLNIGDQPRVPPRGIVSTIAWVYKGKVTYAFEGIIRA
jgi:glycerol kinase